MLARLIPDHREVSRITRRLEDILRACGYLDADAPEKPRRSPAFKLANGERA